MTKSIFFFARETSSKLAVLFLILGTSFFFLPQSAQATCVTTAQSVAAASTAATVLNTEVPSTDSNTAASTPVLVQDTCGGDDVSYQVALPTAVNFQGETYTAVYATTNSTIVFGRQDNDFSNYPMTPSISVNAYDWVVLDPANPNPSNYYPAGWRAPDEHLIITSSQAGFQVDLAVRPYGINAAGVPLSTIVVTAAINVNNTLTITYLSDVQAGLNTRTGVRLPDGRVVTLEEAGLTRVYVAPVVTADVVQPAPSPVPSETATPTASASPSVETATQPSPSPSPVLTPEPSPSSTPIETSTPTPLPSPTVEPQPTPVPVPQPEPQPAPQPVPVVMPDPVVIADPPPVVVEPAPDPVLEEAPVPEPTPVVEPAPEPVQEIVPEPQPEVAPEEPPVVEPEPVAQPPQEPEPKPVVDIAPEPPVVAAPNATDAEKQIVAQAIIEQAHGEPVTAQAIADAGLTYADLPPETPVEVREDKDGNQVVITAEVAAALEVLANPAELINAIFTDPAQALLALSSIGADMSPQERAQSQKTVVAAVIVGQIAGQAAVTAAAGAAAYRRKP